MGANLAMAGVILVIFLYAIDATIVSTAMPMVVANVGGLELYSWVFSIYMLASALAMPLRGRFDPPPPHLESDTIASLNPE